MLANYRIPGKIYLPVCNSYIPYPSRLEPELVGGSSLWLGKAIA
jgi:hypothetical protein